VTLTETTVLEIVCDNPSCPGNDLATDERTGWTFLNREVYGLPTEQFVYCCQTCAGTIEAVPVPPPVGPPVELPPPDPGA
jgi:hypothetical protein